MECQDGEGCRKEDGLLVRRQCVEKELECRDASYDLQLSNSANRGSWDVHDLAWYRT
jgi:hypothetical protein